VSDPRALRVVREGEDVVGLPRAAYRATVYCADALLGPVAAAFGRGLTVRSWVSALAMLLQGLLSVTVR